LALEPVVQTPRHKAGQIQTKPLNPASQRGVLRFSPGAGRIPNPNILHRAGEAPDDLEDRREDVEMLVTVNMGKSQSCFFKKFDLRRDLALNFMPIDPSENGASDKFTTRPGKSARLIDQRRQDIAPQDSSLFHQRQMQANIEFRILPRQRHSFLECTPRHKQRGAGYDSVLKSPHHTSVNGRRESPVIRVDNQLFQGAKSVLLGFRVACLSETQPVLESS
jgi:hypothetical protein